MHNMHSHPKGEANGNSLKYMHSKSSKYIIPFSIFVIIMVLVMLIVIYIYQDTALLDKNETETIQEEQEVVSLPVDEDTPLSSPTD